MKRCGWELGVFTLFFLLLFGNFIIHDGHAFLCLPFLRKGAGSLRLLFATPSYYVYRATWCSNYIHKATNDDIAKNKYIFINLFSKEHHKAFVEVEQDDDYDNRRTNMVTYEIDHQVLPSGFEGATIGAVWYFNQRLDKMRDCNQRTVMTYKDEQGRFCVLIQSFDSSGNRVSMHLYRKKRRVWWLKKVAEEGNSLTKSFMNFAWDLLSKQPTKKRQILNIAESNCPLGMANHKTNFFDLIYNISPGKDVDTIGDVIFRTMPETLNAGTLDLFVWRYFTPNERDRITHVVIAEVFFDYVDLRYYRCISPKDRHYETINSFADTGDIPNLANSDAEVLWAITKTDLVIDYQSQRQLTYEPGIKVIAYPAANHLVIRPMSVSELKLFKTIKVIGPHNTFEMKNDENDGLSYISISDVSEQKNINISLTYMGSRGFDIKGGVLSLESTNTPRASSADQHASFIFKHMMPIYYMNVSLDTVANNSVAIEFNLQSYSEEEVLAAQFDRFTTLYTPNLYGANHFKRCVLNNFTALNLANSYNTQLLFVESEEKGIVILFQAGIKEALLYEVSDNNIRPVDNDTKARILNDRKMMEYENISKHPVKREMKNVILNLNDPMSDRNIDNIVVSSDVVVFKSSSSNIRLSAVIWANQKLTFKPYSTVAVTVISNKHISFLLVDEVLPESSTINRYLYNMESKPTPLLRIVAQNSCEFSGTNMQSVRRCLEQSWYHLIPEKLPFLAEFEDTRLGTVHFPYHNLSIAYLPFWHQFALGSAKFGSWYVEVMQGHRWRQLQKKKEEDKSLGIAYTMTEKGITEQIQAISGDEFSEKLTPFKKGFIATDKEDVPLLVDNIGYSNVKALNSKLGLVTLTTVKPNSQKERFNPVVFGHHEIYLGSGYVCKRVIISLSENELREINLDITNPDGKVVMMTFSQTSKNSEHYNLNDSDQETVKFMDMGRHLSRYEFGLFKLNLLDFNAGNFPHHVRFLTLNESTMYFTGYAPHGGLHVIFGSHKVLLPESGSSYHLWVVYPHGTSETCSLYSAYNVEGKNMSDFYTIEDIAMAKAVKRPLSDNCNWGPLSTMEFSMVNEIVSRMAVLKNELDTVDLDLSVSKREKSILKLTVDGNTTLYTTLASSGAIIGSIDYKGAIIKEIPRCVVKHVYLSQGLQEDIIVVVARTVRKLVVKAYKFGKDNTFESIDYTGVDPRMHSSVYSILKKFA